MAIHIIEKQHANPRCIKVTCQSTLYKINMPIHTLLEQHASPHYRKATCQSTL